MKKVDFVKMIRTIVAEEVKKQLPQIVSEMYIRKIVAESSVPQKKKTSFRETIERNMEEQDEGVPGDDYENTDDGIYQSGGVISRKNEEVRERFSSNPYSQLFETTVPLSKREMIAAQKMETEIPAPSVGEEERPITDYAKIFRAAAGIQEEEDPKAIEMKKQKKLREIAEHRRMLDEMKVG